MAAAAAAAVVATATAPANLATVVKGTVYVAQKADVHVTWDAVVGAVGYRVRWALDSMLSSWADLKPRTGAAAAPTTPGGGGGKGVAVEDLFAAPECVVPDLAVDTAYVVEVAAAVRGSGEGAALELTPYVRVPVLTSKPQDLLATLRDSETEAVAAAKREQEAAAAQAETIRRLTGEVEALQKREVKLVQHERTTKETLDSKEAEVVRLSTALAAAEGGRKDAEGRLAAFREEAKTSQEAALREQATQLQARADAAAAAAASAAAEARAVAVAAVREEWDAKLQAAAAAASAAEGTRVALEAERDAAAAAATRLQSEVATVTAARDAALSAAAVDLKRSQDNAAVLAEKVTLMVRHTETLAEQVRGFVERHKTLAGFLVSMRLDATADSALEVAAGAIASLQARVADLEAWRSGDEAAAGDHAAAGGRGGAAAH